MMQNQSGRSQAHSLGDHLNSDVPAQLLVVGEIPAASLGETVDGVSVRRFATLADAQTHSTQINAENLSARTTPQALVLALNPCESNLDQILGRAIRAFPYRVLVHCADNPASAAHQGGVRDAVFFALGFRRLALVVKDDSSTALGTARWFEYRLSQYKSAPDWLNARYWANPERFDVDENPDSEYEDGDEEE